jgi:hypothetical protein
MVVVFYQQSATAAGSHQAQVSPPGFPLVEPVSQLCCAERWPGYLVVTPKAEVGAAVGLGAWMLKTYPACSEVSHMGVNMAPARRDARSNVS